MISGLVLLWHKQKTQLRFNKEPEFFGKIKAPFGALIRAKTRLPLLLLCCSLFLLGGCFLLFLCHGWMVGDPVRMSRGA